MAATAKNQDELIRLTADGRWLQGKKEITHERTCELFFKSIVSQNGKYFLMGDQTPVLIVVEDAPYFVKDWQSADATSWGEIVLSDGTREPLDPSTLDVGASNKLYCRVKGGEFKALFERRVYNHLMKDLVERDGFYGIMRGDLYYPIRRKEELYPVEVAPAPVKPALPKFAPVRETDPLIFKKSVPVKTPAKPVKLAKVKPVVQPNPDQRDKSLLIKSKLMQKMHQIDLLETKKSPVKKPAQKIVKKTVKKLVKKPVKKMVKKPLKKIAKKPVKKVMKNPAKKSAKKPVKKIVKKKSKR